LGDAVAGNGLSVPPTSGVARMMQIPVSNVASVGARRKTAMWECATLNYVPHHEDIGGSGGVAAPTPDLDIGLLVNSELFPLATISPRERPLVSVEYDSG
jgi:hypothetical protein